MQLTSNVKIKLPFGDCGECGQCTPTISDYSLYQEHRGTTIYTITCEHQAACQSLRRRLSENTTPIVEPEH